MKNCALCKKPIEVRVKAVSVVGGLFPAEDPEFFMIDDNIMKESHLHMECFMEVISRGVRNSQDGS